MYIRSKVVGDLVLNSLGTILPAGQWTEIDKMTEELKRLESEGAVEVKHKIHPDSFVGKMQRIRESQKHQRTVQKQSLVKKDRAEPDRREQHPVRMTEIPEPVREFVEQEMERRGEPKQRSNPVSVLPEIRPTRSFKKTSVPDPVKREAPRGSVKVSKDEKSGRRVVECGDWGEV